MIDDLANNVGVQITMMLGATLLLVWASRHREQRQRAGATRSGTRPRSAGGNGAGQGRSDQASEALPPLAARAWLDIVNNRPHEVAHLAIFGPSGSGKTTLCQGILAQRGGQVIVIDPKPARPGQMKWGGMPYVQIDPNGSYRSIDRTLRALRREVNWRLAALSAGQEPALLTIVLDEYKSLVRECPDSAPDLLLRVSDIGRELGMCLIILSQSRGVAALGVKGQGDTRENFVTITVDKKHQATLEWDEDEYALDTAPVIADARRPIPTARWWGVPVFGQDQSAPRISAGFEAVPDQTGLAGFPQSDAETGWSARKTDNGEESIEDSTAGTGALLDAETIRALVQAGWSKNHICTKLRGAKDKKLRLIDAATREVVNTP